MTHATSMITIHAPPNAIWRVISDFDVAGQVLSRIVNCTVEGEGVGARAHTDQR